MPNVLQDLEGTIFQAEDAESIAFHAALILGNSCTRLPVVVPSFLVLPASNVSIISYFCCMCVTE